MIDKTDLRIGNVIMDVNAPVTSFRTVKAIGLTKVVYDNCITADFEAIKPILITPNWLNKLGFERKGDYWHPQKSWHRYCLIHFRKADNIYTLSFEPEGLKETFEPMRFVHQVQNFHYALTSRELKIEIS